MSELKENNSTDPSVDLNALYELVGGMYVQLLRIYDLIGLIASGNSNQDNFDKLFSLHESGKVLSPAPALILDDE
jgi:hypothetical protein